MSLYPRSTAPATSDAGGLHPSSLGGSPVSQAPDRPMTADEERRADLLMDYDRGWLDAAEEVCS